MFFWSKTAIYRSPGLHKVHPSYRRSLQLSKEAIQHLKTWTFKNFFYFCGSFLPSWIPIRIPNPDSLTRLNPDLDPQPCAQVEFLPALQSATGKQFPAPGEELESADGLQFLVDLCATHGVQVAPPLTLPRVLGMLLFTVFTVLRVRIRDPVLFWPLDPGPGMGKIRIRDDCPRSFFREL